MPSTLFKIYLWTYFGFSVDMTNNVRSCGDSEGSRKHHFNRGWLYLDSGYKTFFFQVPGVYDKKETKINYFFPTINVSYNH